MVVPAGPISVWKSTTVPPPPGSGRGCADPSMPWEKIESPGAQAWAPVMFSDARSSSCHAGESVTA